jgi:hypothetical protein
MNLGASREYLKLLGNNPRTAYAGLLCYGIAATAILTTLAMQVFTVYHAALD